jgi:hypothetical protein
MRKLSLFLPRARTPECSNFLGMDACSLSHWAYLLGGSGVLRCMFSGTGAVPTVNVTLFATRES